MRIEPFLMERWQSTWEHEVELNLSDSGVHPVDLRELLEGPEEFEELQNQRLVYTQTNGTPELRRLVAGLHPGASEDEVLITNGGAEANFIAAWTLLEPGDEVVMMLPNYMQLYGIVRHFGAVIRPWRLEPQFATGRWSADPGALAELVTPRTKLIVLCNPNNPTGARLDESTLDAVCRAAERHGAWVLCDEIYRGTDLDGGATPTVWGRTERAIVTGSLSKAYGLPGLRLGWVVAPRKTIETLWAQRDYTTIGPGALSDFLARKALRPATRARLLERARALLIGNYALVSAWLERHPGTLEHVPPAAGAMLYLCYANGLNSTALAERLRDEQSVLVVPGDHFRMDGWLRIGFGSEAHVVERGLERVDELLRSLEGRA